MPLPGEIATDLARKARALLEDMRARAGRDPDVADYAVAFEKILQHHKEKSNGFAKVK